MGQRFDYEDDNYSVHWRDDGGKIQFHLEFKKQPVAFAPSGYQPGQGKRVILPANEHHRRKGILEDEATVIVQGDGMFEVSSRTEPGAWHTVHLDSAGDGVCTCAAYTLGHRLCRHIKAARVVEGYPMDMPLRDNTRHPNVRVHAPDASTTPGTDDIVKE